MRIFAFVVLTLSMAFASAQDSPKDGGTKEVVISLANSTKAVADQMQIGSSIDVIIEEPGASPHRTVMPGKRVIATTNDKRKKDGQTITVYLTSAQARAFDILKDSGTVIIELHKNSVAKTPSTKTKKGA